MLKDSVVDAVAVAGAACYSWMSHVSILVALVLQRRLVFDCVLGCASLCCLVVSM